MKPISNLLFFICSLGLIQGCNSLYNSHVINMEVIVPGKIAFSPEYQKVAVRYHNCNVTQNPYFADFSAGNKIFTDTINTDSIASEVYFQVFAEHLNNQRFFDSIIEIQPFNYSGIQIIDTTKNQQNTPIDSLKTDSITHAKFAVSRFTSLLKNFPANHPNEAETRIINPEYGLYSKEEIQQIADSTEADLLFSFDYFASTDETTYLQNSNSIGIESVLIIVFWNIYDLNKQELEFFHEKCDTIVWNTGAVNLQYAKKTLPPRKDAILNAADIAGTRFAELLVPHWIEVQRMYYQSGHVDLKKTNELINENKWLEAAEIWKTNITNPNKSIAAKCMFNMAVACEMEGNIDAAIDWAVKSFYILGQKNEVHYINCMNYINILAQRKLDIKNINKLMNREILESNENKNE